MNIRICHLVLFTLSIILACSGCTITLNARSAVVFKDYSFPATGDIFERTSVASIIEKKGDNNSEPLSSTAISITGQVFRPKIFSTSFFMRIIKLKNQGDGHSYTQLEDVRVPYRWDGTISIDGNIKSAVIEFDAYGASETGEGSKHFKLTGAVLDKERLQFDDPVDVQWGNHNFPFLLGYAFSGDLKYSVYAVLDNWPGKNDWWNEVFFNPLQKFQILDENGEVLAELEGEIFTIYDTMPEEQRASFKKIIALFLAFKHSTTVIRDSDRWDLPRNYRYVFPVKNV